MFKWLVGLFKTKEKSFTPIDTETGDVVEVAQEIIEGRDITSKVNDKKDNNNIIVGQTDSNPYLASLLITDMLFYLFKNRNKYQRASFYQDTYVLEGFGVTSEVYSPDFKIHLISDSKTILLLQNEKVYKPPFRKYKLRWHKGASKCVRDGFYFLLKNEYYKEVSIQEEISKQKEIELAERREEELKVLDRLCIKKEK